MRSSGEAQYERIRAEILDGSLKPGELLLETALAKSVGVSRTPVREAMTRLAQEGLLERAPRGYLVPERSPQELVDVFDARIALESAAARLAADRATPDDISQLNYLVSSRRDADDLGAQERLNSLFHITLIDASHNETVIRMLDQIRTLLAIYRPIYLQARTVEDSEIELSEHLAMLDAVRDRDGRRAHDLMVTHLTRGRDARVRSLVLREGDGPIDD